MEPDNYMQSESVEDTRAIGLRLADVLEPGDLVVLSGDLGAGKTLLVAAIAEGLGIEGPVLSPTFALANEYEGRITLHHLDVYRFESPDEVSAAFDIDELLATGCVVIEWGELIESVLPTNRTTIRIEHLDDTDNEVRRISIDSSSSLSPERFHKVVEVQA